MEKKVLFIDLDGTLIETISGDIFPRGIWDMKWKDGVLDAIKKLAPEYLFIVTNQGGIEKGFVDKRNFEFKMEYIVRGVKEYINIPIVEYSYCTSNDSTNEYRKPNIGMLYSLCHKYIHETILAEEFLMVGDASGLEGQFSDSDKKTAENFGCVYMDVDEFIQMYR